MIRLQLCNENDRNRKSHFKGADNYTKKIRDMLGVSGGDKILFENIDGNIVLKKAEYRDMISILDQIKPMKKSTIKLTNGLRNE